MLVRVRVAEVGRHAVARELPHQAAEVGDDLAIAVLESREHGLQLFRVELRRKRVQSEQVASEDCYLASLKRVRIDRLDGADARRLVLRFPLRRVCFLVVWSVSLLANFAIERLCRGLGLHAEFFRQHVAAEPILRKRSRVPALHAIELHQGPMRAFLKRIEGQKPRRDGDAALDVAGANVVREQFAQRANGLLVQLLAN